MKPDKEIFENYAKNIHFLDEKVPDLMKNLFKGKKDISVLDLGCGDGKLLFALKNQKLLDKAKKVVGVDISEKRVKKCSQILKNISFITSDACNVKQLKDNSFDIIISSMVIEHVPDDRRLLKEIKRLLKKDGFAYVTSVIKGKHAFYIYKNNGVIRLDPTHVREYGSKEDFESLIISEGLIPVKTNLEKCKYSLVDIALRGLFRLRIIKPNNALFVRHNNWRWIRDNVQIPILGYKSIEVVMKKAM